MHDNDLTWMIGGPQGSGLDTAAETFSRAALRMGLRVTWNREYHSNIMGEHSYCAVRVSNEDRHSLLDRVNVLVALDEETLTGNPHDPHSRYPGHLPEVVPGGIVIYDSGGKFNPAKAGRDDITLLGVPLMDLLRQALAEFGREGDASRLRIMTNAVASAASLFALGGDINAYVSTIRSEFTGRRAALAEPNVRAAEVAFDYVARELGRSPYKLRELAARSRENHPANAMLIRGMQACALGKLKAGLHLQTYYPISPATDENVYLEGLQRDHDVLVVQCEDEIAAIQMAVGAANAGARASTSTSGPGFALMVEGIGYASIVEAGGPVIVLWSRGGPSTGLPTRQDQSDLRFALHPAQGDFPHIVVAPSDTQEIFDDAFESFNWADRYQVPVVILVDKTLATQAMTLDAIKQEGLRIDRGLRFTGNGRVNGESHKGYQRFAFTESGVSPRAFPGEEGGVFWSTSDEHDPEGHITEDAENRIRMMEKRMGKLDRVAREIPPERKIGVYGPKDAELTLVGWGSTKGVMLDAMEVLAAEGVAVNFVQVRLMRPFPVEEVTQALAGAKRLALVEGSYSGNLAGLIREKTGIDIPQMILKYDGRPFSEEELVEALRQALATKDERIHVSHLLA